MHECAAEPWGGEPETWPLPECTHPEHWATVQNVDDWLDWDDAPAECRWAQVHQYCDLDEGHSGPHHWSGLTERLPMVDLRPATASA